MPLPARNLMTSPRSQPSVLDLVGRDAAPAEVSPRNPTPAAAKEDAGPLARFAPAAGLTNAVLKAEATVFRTDVPGPANAAVRLAGKPADVPATPRQAFDRLATTL